MEDFLSSPIPGEEETPKKPINKTHELILKLHSEYYNYVRPKLTNNYLGFKLSLPIIPESHLLADTTNKKSLRNEIEQLIRKKIIRSFQMGNPPFSSERFFMLMNDYINQVKSQGSQIATDFADKVIPNHIKTTIPEKELISFGFNKEQIIDLTRIHLLYINNDEYVIGIPAGTAFFQSISDGRQGVVAYLKRMPDSPRFDVEKKIIDGSIYYSSFHTKSLYGLGVISFRKSASGEERVHLIYDPYTGKKI